MALSLGAEGIDYLEPGEFQSFVSYRWLTADTGYIGTDEDKDYDERVGADITVQSVDVNLTYALTRRFSLSLTTPLIYARAKDRLSHGGAYSSPRHTTHASGLGDIRLTANAWLFDPDTSNKGNVVLSLGVKAPTGNDDVTDTFYKPSGPERDAVDISIQPGDGGWGVILEMQSFRSIFERTYVYGTGYYLINPREDNGVYTQIPAYGQLRKVSVPDQYQARAGLSYALWPHQGLAVSLGGRIDGQPQEDLIGGNGGFRRPGYSIYVEPGLTLSRGKNTFSLYVPVGVAYNRQRSELDKDNDGHGPGAFADYLIVFSISRRF
jgi:hypothetical protein